MNNPGLWNPENNAFIPANLHRAIVARGWNVPEFSRAARLNPCTVYAALKGKRISDSTAIRIFEALEKRQPMRVAIPFLAPDSAGSAPVV